MTDAEKAAWRAGAEAMRRVAAELVEKGGWGWPADLCDVASDIRALPLPEPPDA